MGLKLTESAVKSSDQIEALKLVPVSRETEARFEAYTEHLIRWQKIKNLVGPKTLSEVWTRHIADSAQLARFIDQNTKYLVDLGSGAGFPGLVLACLFADRSGFEVHLVESNGRKAAFLREVSRALELPVYVHDKRIEDALDALSFRIDVLTARALAPLSELVAMYGSLPQQPRKALFLKGQDIDSELTEAAKYWNIDYEIHPSLTNSEGRILVVHAVKPGA
ncbi:MAG: 16S rRNA (guanine(527)-N(7))-methyltransferase RsmG [Hyphomicrobiales bacterium]|nr:16S rRNA (guanine(527)-N(7))-methyltransferase RsmG [Hyphomicrobiales bacterium]